MASIWMNTCGGFRSQRDELDEIRIFAKEKEEDKFEPDVSEDQADQFVTEIREWGLVFPKLAQRLRQNKKVVKSDIMRDRLRCVLEGCKSRTEKEVCQHLVQHYQPLLPPLPDDAFEFVSTLGTGSIAQVVLFKIDGEEKVMKMTWLQDKARFENDFDLFAWWLSVGTTLRKVMGQRVEEFLLFLKIVMSKQQEILKEFDLTHEANATLEGAALIEESWKELRLAVAKIGDNGDCGVLQKQIRAPAVKLHSPQLLEQERAGGDSLEEILKIRNEVCYAAHQVYCELFVPLSGYMLMHKGMTHADAHFGNLRYDHKNGTFWVIDWGAVVRLDDHRRQGLQRLVTELHLQEAFELPDADAQKAMLELTNNKQMDMRIWMHSFNPRTNPLPQHIDYEEMKESISNDPQLVLCLETVLMLSFSLNHAADIVRNFGCSYLGAKVMSSASLLTYWATPASFELLSAIRNHDADAAALAISKGARLQARFIDSDQTALQAACEMDTVALANVMQRSWESCRPSQPSIKEAVHKFSEELERKARQEA